MLLPTGIVETRAPEAVVTDPFTAVTLVRGTAPLACLVVVLWLVGTPAALRRPRRVEIALIAYVSVVVSSSVWSLAPVATLLKAGHLVIAYALLALLVRSWRDKEQGLVEVAGVVYGVVLLAAASALLAPEAAFSSYGGRLLSVFPALEAVVLALFCCLALVLLLAGVGPSMITARPWTRGGLAIITTTVLVLTGSRLAVALVVVGAVALVRGRPRFRPWPMGLGVLVSGAVFASAAGDVLRSRLHPDVLSASLQNLGGRLPLWQDAWAVFSERPLHGYGYYAGHRVGPYAERFSERGMMQEPYVDGTWIESLLDVGLLGTVCLAGFVALGMSDAARSRRSSTSGPVHLAVVIVLGLWSLQDYTVQQVGYPMVVFGALLLMPAARGATNGAALRSPDDDPSQAFRQAGHASARPGSASAGSDRITPPDRPPRRSSLGQATRMPTDQ